MSERGRLSVSLAKPRASFVMSSLKAGLPRFRLVAWSPAQTYRNGIATMCVRKIREETRNDKVETGYKVCFVYYSGGPLLPWLASFVQSSCLLVPPFIVPVSGAFVVNSPRS